MWNKKNRSLFILFIITNVITIVIYSFSPNKSYNDIDRSLFVLDTSQVNTIHLIKESNSFSLYKNRKAWFDKNKKMTNQQKVYFILAVLSQNQIKSKLTTEEGENIFKKFKQNEVKIVVDDLSPLYIICNNRQSQTYWTLNHVDYYNVGIEGYSVNICSAFITDSLYWKNNYIFKQHLRYLSNIDYTNMQLPKKDYKITLSNGKLKTNFESNNKEEGLAKWMQAMAGIEYVDYILKDKVRAYDSLLQTKLPLAKLTQNKMMEQTESELYIYPRLKDDEFHVIEFGDKNIIGRVHKSTFSLMNDFKSWAMKKKLR